MINHKLKLNYIKNVFNLVEIFLEQIPKIGNHMANITYVYCEITCNNLRNFGQKSNEKK